MHYCSHTKPQDHVLTFELHMQAFDSLRLRLWKIDNYQLSIFQMYFHHQRWIDI